MLTSGTTGPSKAVSCTYVQAWCGAAMGMDYFDADDRVLANLPLFHVSGAGAVMDRLTKGGTCVLYDGFKPATFWDTVRRFDITGGCLVGAMTQFLLRQPPSERDRDHPLRNVVTVPWNQDSHAVAERYGLQMHTAFNMTETAVPIRSSANPRGARHLRPAARGHRSTRRRWQRHRSARMATVGELILRASRPWEMSAGLLQQSAGHGRGLAQWLVPHRRCIPSRRRRQFLLRRPDQGRDPPPRREHFVVRSGGRGPVSPGGARGGGALPVPSTESEDEVLLVVTANAGHVDRAARTAAVPRPAHGAFHAAALHPGRCRRCRRRPRPRSKSTGCRPRE